MLAGFLAGAELQGCFLVKFPECFYEAGAAFVSGFMADLQDTEAGIAKKLGGSVKFVDAIHYVKGEGIEKKADDFAAEVAAQIAGASK